MKNKKHTKSLSLILKNIHPTGNFVHNRLTTLAGKRQAGQSGLFKGMDHPLRSGMKLAAHKKPAKQQKKSLISQKQLETTLDHMVASTLVNGPRTTNVLRSMFDLVPSLIGR